LRRHEERCARPTANIIFPPARILLTHHRYRVCRITLREGWRRRQHHH
jgi:hypothetical protein